MLKRTITGAFILIFVVLFVFLKRFNDLFFDAFVLIVLYCSLYETINAYHLSKKEIDFSIFFLPAIICIIYNLTQDTFRALGYVVLTVFIFILYLLTMEIISYAVKRKNGEDEKDIEKLNQTLFDKTKNTMMILAYPTIILSLLFALNHLSYEASFMGIILAFAVSMSTDTLAYVFGRAYGKRKFIPEVSPKKTIAGMIGGFYGGVLASCICLYIFVNVSGFLSVISGNESKFVLVFSIVGVLGAWADQLGDLVASALKRKVGIKDYANIFPGHGGFMDRVDGLMFTSALIYILFALFLV